MRADVKLEAVLVVESFFAEIASKFVFILAMGPGMGSEVAFGKESFGTNCAQEVSLIRVRIFVNGLVPWNKIFRYVAL